MKIAEVCRITGLTERTVRFYVEEGLVQPETHLRNGREYREYADTDIQDLQTIALLRRAGFSLEEIRCMKETPHEIRHVVEAMRERLRNEIEGKQRILKRLDALEESDMWSLRTLSQRLAKEASHLPLPQSDISPRFDGMEDTPEDEKTVAYLQYQDEQEKRYQRGRGIVIALAVFWWLEALGQLLQLHILEAIFFILLGVGLISGLSWVRYLVAVLSLIGALGLFVTMGVNNFFLASMPAFVLFTTSIVLNVTAALLLFFNRAVEEYLYARRHP